jgi:hypothetical protein
MSELPSGGSTPSILATPHNLAVRVIYGRSSRHFWALAEAGDVTNLDFDC